MQATQVRAHIATVLSNITEQMHDVPSYTNYDLFDDLANSCAGRFCNKPIRTWAQGMDEAAKYHTIVREALIEVGRDPFISAPEYLTVA